MRLRKSLIAALTVFPAIAAAQPAPAPAPAPSITGADGGYKLAYDAFCANDHVQLNNVMSLNKMGQISDEAFVNARFATLKSCARMMMGGLPEGTVQAIGKLRDVKRVFQIPGGVLIGDAATGNRVGSATLFNQDYTLLLWYVQKNAKPDSISRLIAAGADVNWRNELAFPIVYYAIWKRNADTLKALVDAGARVDIQVPRMTWSEQNADLVYSDYVTTQAHSIPYGSIQLHSAQLKPEFANSAVLWKDLQARRLTTSLLAYTAGTCTEFRSPECWKLLHILLDKGVKVPRDFLHLFFRPDGTFTIHARYPEGSEGLDRLIKLGASLNATNAKGQTILARIMQTRANPETMQALIARGAQLQAEPPSASPVPLPKPTAKQQ